MTLFQKAQRLPERISRRAFHWWHGMPSHLIHRRQGYSLLSGEGVEIGALHQPAVLPRRCRVEYLDCIPKTEASSLFPEIDSKAIVDVTYIADLDRDDLPARVGRKFDFVILNHVIEHVANPLRILEQVFALLREGGLAVLSAPDKNFTFDAKRSLTAFEHCLAEYRENISESSDEHYLDFLRGVHPEVFANKSELESTLASAKRRREHVHVWDSDSFRTFLDRGFGEVLGIPTALEFESRAAENGSEYFSVWRKL